MKTVCQRIKSIKTEISAAMLVHVLFETNINCLLLKKAKCVAINLGVNPLFIIVFSSILD